MSLRRKSLSLPSPADALLGRPNEMPVPDGCHAVLGTPLKGPFAGMELAQFGMGCFRGAEKRSGRGTAGPV